MPGIQFNADQEDTVPFGDMIPLQEGDLPTGVLTGVAWDQGLDLNVTHSVARFTEQFGEKYAIGEALNDIYKKPNITMLDPKTANEKYGIPGALSFSAPVRDTVAAILRERKDIEIAQSFILGQAKGSQNLGVFGAELAAGLLDPGALLASIVPIVPEAMYLTWAGKYGTTAARIGTGLIEGGVGNAMIEPIIYGQAQYEQREYGALNSLVNIVGGAVFGGGLHFAAGKVVDWLGAVQMKHHLKALQTAVNQAAEGQKVEVTPILSAEAADVDTSVKVNFEDDTATTNVDATGATGPPLNIAGAKIADIDHYINTNGGHLNLYFTSGTNTEAVNVKILDDGSGGDEIIFTDVSTGMTETLSLADVYEMTPVSSSGIEVGKNPPNFIMQDDAGDLQPTVALDKFLNENPGPYTLFMTDGSVHTDVTELTNWTSVITAKLFPGADIEKIDKWAIHTIIKTEPLQGTGSAAGPAAKTSPLVMDTTDGMDLFAAANHIEALNFDNLTPDNVGQLGSIPGDVYTDSINGKRYYVKLPPPDKIEQARQEFISSIFYRMGGQQIPPTSPVLQDHQFIGVASEWVEGSKPPSTQVQLFKALNEYRKTDPDGFERFMRGIVFDMWLANWDWASPNNILITPDGVPMRIDFGATMQYRATGVKKTPDQFSENVLEFEYYKDPNSAPNASQHFARMKTLIDSFPDSKWQEGVNDLAIISDEDITTHLWNMGLTTDEAADISATLIARRIAIMEKYKGELDPSVMKSAEFYDNVAINDFLDKTSAIWKSLSQKASKALSSYKGIGYDSLNAWLRNGTPPGADKGQQLATMRDAMDAAVQGFAFPQETYLWRGGVPAKVFKNWGVQYNDAIDVVRKKLLGSGISVKISDPAFISTSVNKSIAVNFNKGPSNFVFRIKVPKGQAAAIPLGNMKKLSNTAGDSEAEFVLPRDTHMVVTDVFKDKTSGNTVINVKVVPHNAKIKKTEAASIFKMAEKHYQDFSSVADDAHLDAELTYSLKESMGIPETTELVTAINEHTTEMVGDLKKSAPDDEALENSLKQIDETYGTMTKQGNAMAKGAMAAFGCVMKNANL